jgi:hypothetical protein
MKDDEAGGLLDQAIRQRVVGRNVLQRVPMRHPCMHIRRSSDDSTSDENLDGDVSGRGYAGARRNHRGWARMLVC